MICKVCDKVSNSIDNEDCFEKSLDILKKHYSYYKNALLQRELELQQVKERNEQLNKALRLLQNNQQPAKRFKSQHSDDSWAESSSSQEAVGGTNLNVALNSEQLFDTSALSQTKNDESITSFSEMLQSPRVKDNPKRRKSQEAMRLLKDRNTKGVERSKSEWYAKEDKSPMEKSWAMKFLQPTKLKALEEKICEDKKKTIDKKLSLSLKKTNPSKIKQSLLPFNKSKDNSFRESDIGDDIIDASPVIVSKNSKAGRSWTHRSGHNCISNNVTKEPTKKDEANETLEDIVFDFSPSKKTDSTLNLNYTRRIEPKELKFDSDISKDCISLPNNDLGISTNKSDTSSVVILTPATQDIIFVEDTINLEPEIDTMELLKDIINPENTDNLENLKKYESKCIQNQQRNKETDIFKKPSCTNQTGVKTNNLGGIKQEKITQENVRELKDKKQQHEKPSCSKSGSKNNETTKPQNPLFSAEEQDTEDDDDFMPKPFLIKQENEISSKKLSIKERFNINCEDCQKLVNFLDEGLTDAQIQQHLDKCKRHNNPEIMRQNTPTDFWNPFILSFQADDPRNEILFDNRFKDAKN